MLADEPLGVLVHREQVHQLVAEDGHAARLQADDRGARLDLRPQACRGSRAAGPWPCRACRSRRAAGRSRATCCGTTTWKPASSRTSTAALAVCGMEVVVERVGPEDDARACPTFRGAPARPPRLEGLRRERRRRPPGRDPAEPSGTPCRRPAACVTRLTTPGASEASRAHQ